MPESGSHCEHPSEMLQLYQWQTEGEKTERKKERRMEGEWEQRSKEGSKQKRGDFNNPIVSELPLVLTPPSYVCVKGKLCVCTEATLLESNWGELFTI